MAVERCSVYQKNALLRPASTPGAPGFGRQGRDFEFPFLSINARDYGTGPLTEQIVHGGFAEMRVAQPRPPHSLASQAFQQQLHRASTPTHDSRSIHSLSRGRLTLWPELPPDIRAARGAMALQPPPGTRPGTASSSRYGLLDTAMHSEQHPRAMAHVSNAAATNAAAVANNRLKATATYQAVPVPDWRSRPGSAFDPGGRPRREVPRAVFEPSMRSPFPPRFDVALYAPRPG